MTNATVDPTCTAARHGDPTSYSAHRCRCTSAREAWRVYKKALRDGTHIPARIDATPTTTRLRVLAALGYDWRTLARAYGCSARYICALGRGHFPTVYPATADKVAALFADLTRRPAPCGYAAARAVDNAKRAGWGLVDMEVVRRALAGQRPTLTPLERAAAVHIGHARGVPTTVIAIALGANNTTVAQMLGKKGTRP